MLDVNGLGVTRSFYLASVLVAGTAVAGRPSRFPAAIAPHFAERIFAAELSAAGVVRRVAGEAGDARVFRLAGAQWSLNERTRCDASQLMETLSASFCHDDALADVLTAWRVLCLAEVLSCFAAILVRYGLDMAISADAKDILARSLTNSSIVKTSCLCELAVDDIVMRHASRASHPPSNLVLISLQNYLGSSPGESAHAGRVATSPRPTAASLLFCEVLTGFGPRFRACVPSRAALVEHRRMLHH